MPALVRGEVLVRRERVSLLTQELGKGGVSGVSGVSLLRGVWVGTAREEVRVLGATAHEACAHGVGLCAEMAPAQECVFKSFALGGGTAVACLPEARALWGGGLGRGNRGFALALLRPTGNNVWWWGWGGWFVGNVSECGAAKV